MHELTLGTEYDDALFARLCAAVTRLGGSIEDGAWTLGGSQEVTTYKIRLPSGELEAVAETYIGLSLKGSEVLVSALASEMQYE